MATAMKACIVELKRLGACKEALARIDTQPDWDTAWQTCSRGDWMLWLIGGKADKPDSESRKKLVLVACECAKLSLPYVLKSETRPLRAIETAEAWARNEGNITLEDVIVAAYAAYAAANGAYVAANAANVAYAANVANVAYAAYAAAYAAAHAANLAYAANATVNVAYVATSTTILLECADIVRKHYPSFSF